MVTYDLLSVLKVLLSESGNSENIKLVTNVNNRFRGSGDYSLYIDSELVSGDIETLVGRVDFVDSVNKERKGKYQIKLNRAKIFKSTISLVNTMVGRFGHVGRRHGVDGLINIPNLFETEVASSFDRLRSLYLASFLTKLLQANGFQVHLTHDVDIEKYIGGLLSNSPGKDALTNGQEDLNNYFANGQESLICTETNDETSKDVNNRFSANQINCHKNLELSDWFEDIKNRSKVEKDLYETLEETDSRRGEKIERIKINIKKYLEENGLESEFSANVNFIIFSSFDDAAKQLKCLDSFSKRANESHPLTCIHITHNNSYLLQQKIDATWRILNRNGNSVAQIHLIYCRVTTDDKNNQEFDPAKLLLTRKSQIASAFKSKYGLKKAAFFTDEMMESMAKSSLRFEFLSIKPTVETKVSVNNSCFEDRSGVFVFYNFARIATLMDKFDKLVAKGFYPPLPEADQINFECLKLEDEWNILLSYVMEFPNVVKDSVTQDEKGFIKDVVTHKICTLLTGLSSSFSKYYSKTHILGDPLPHLLMTMQARLHLVLAIKQVYSNAFELLSINALQRL